MLTPQEFQRSNQANQAAAQQQNALQQNGLQQNAFQNLNAQDRQRFSSLNPTQRQQFIALTSLTPSQRQQFFTLPQAQQRQFFGPDFQRNQWFFYLTPAQQQILFSLTPDQLLLFLLLTPQQQYLFLAILAAQQQRFFPFVQQQPTFFFDPGQLLLLLQSNAIPQQDVDRIQRMSTAQIQSLLPQLAAHFGVSGANDRNAFGATSVFGAQNTPAGTTATSTQMAFGVPAQTGFGAPAQMAFGVPAQTGSITPPPIASTTPATQTAFGANAAGLPAASDGPTSALQADFVPYAWSNNWPYRNGNWSNNSWTNNWSNSWQPLQFSRFDDVEPYSFYRSGQCDVPSRAWHLGDPACTPGYIAHAYVPWE